MSFTLRTTYSTLRNSQRGRASLRVYSTASPMDKVGGKVTAKEQLAEAKKEVAEVIKTSKCAPILVRLAWHDSGTYDQVGILFIHSRRPWLRWSLVQNIAVLPRSGQQLYQLTYSII